jgi:hypothetical protein
MPRLRTIQLALLIFSVVACAVAQDNSQQQGAAPAPAFGQNAPVLNPENPPLSGIDEPGLELKTAGRSFISPAILVSETADSNENNQLGASAVHPVEHVLAALDLQKFWSKSDLFLEYLGGGAFQTVPRYDAKQLEALGFEGVTRWRTGYAQLRDSFSYVPDGSFSTGTAGGIPGLGIALGGLGTGEAGGGLPGIVTFNNAGVEVVGQIPRIANTAIASVIQAISPRSAFTVLGAFANTHYYDHKNCSGPVSLQTNCLRDSDQTTAEVGYSHLLSRRDQIAGVYAFEVFRFPYHDGGEIYSNGFNVRWSHTITGRMQLILGVGPQYTDLRFGDRSTQWSVRGRASLRYRFAHASLVASWEKYTSAGSGYFPGANTQAAQLAYSRALGRTYRLNLVAGYAHNDSVQSLQSVPGLFATSANSYNSGTATAALRKHIGRTYDLFAAFGFNDVEFNTANAGANCGSPDGIGCGSIARRYTGSIGLEWHPKATRIE